MITRVLEKLGLFMGWRRDPNDEAMFFWRLNDWALSQTGYSWDRPPTFSTWPDDDVLQRMMELGFREALLGLAATEYWGLRRLADPGHAFRARAPWGWKDPRNTITLPVWLSIFPDARVVHIRRHGLDVARSLKARNDAVESSFQARKLRYPFPIPGLKNLWVSAACRDITSSFNLWETYVSLAEYHVHKLGVRALDLKYETFLAEPREMASQIASFCGLDTEPPKIEEACNGLRSDRAFAFRTDPEIVALEVEFSERLAAHGY